MNPHASRAQVRSYKSLGGGLTRGGGLWCCFRFDGRDMLVGMYHARGHRSLRKGRISLPGQVYLLTTTTARRRALFARFSLACRVCRHTDNPASWADARLLCWVLMPDHWHGLLQLGDASTLADVMSRWKATTSRHLRHQGCTGPVWSRGFHDHALRRTEDAQRAARYLIANPVRAGLVATAMQYPFWNAIWIPAPV